MTQSAPLDYAPARPRRGRGLFGWVLFIALAVMLFMFLQQNRGSAGYDEIALSEFNSRLVVDQIDQITISGDTIYGTFDRPYLIGTKTITNFRVPLAQGMGSSWEMTHWILENRRNAEVRVQNDSNLMTTILLPLVPWVLILAFIWFFVFRQLRSARRTPTPVTIVNPADIPAMERP